MILYSLARRLPKTLLEVQGSMKLVDSSCVCLRCMILFSLARRLPSSLLEVQGSMKLVDSTCVCL